MYKYRYLYEIHIENEDSSFNDCYYYGQHSTNNLDDGYFGSGKLISFYISKYGTFGLHKKILSFHTTMEELNTEEEKLIIAKKSLLKERCLNLSEGASMQNWTLYASDDAIENWKHQISAAQKNYWDNLDESVRENRCKQLKQQSLDIVKNSSKDELKYRAICGGLANKRRLENPVEHEKWVNTCKNVHANMSKEDKIIRYTKVSESLKDFYADSENIDIINDMKEKNKQSNIIASKQWRTEFYKIFGCTPESFRKFGKLKHSIQLYKQIKDLDERTKKYEVDRFMESINK